MKSKILFQFFLISCLGIIYTTLKSDSNGKHNGGTSCGGNGCHGSAANTATTVAINGLPATFITGQTYPLTFTVSNSTLSKAGFNILASGGTFTAGTGSKTNTSKNQITHDAPMSAVSGITTFSFSWTAPSTTAAVTFSGVGNAVNNNNNADAGDQWNTTTNLIPGAFPASISNIESSITIKSYPNPANDFVILEGLNSNTKFVKVYNMSGQEARVPYSISANKCTLNTNYLPIGIYFILAHQEGKMLRSTFAKQ